jgi:hypothetical protein
VLHIREHLRDRRQVWRWRQVADIAVTPAQMATLRDAEFAPVSEIRTPSDEDGHDGDSDGDDHTAAHTAATDDDSAVADDGAAADERDASHTKDDHQGGASG